jgi:hypothetical protein
MKLHLTNVAQTIRHRSVFILRTKNKSIDAKRKVPEDSEPSAIPIDGHLHARRPKSVYKPKLVSHDLRNLEKSVSIFERLQIL